MTWVMNIWSSTYNKPCPVGLAANKQSAWDKLVSASERLELTDNQSKTENQARLIAVTSAHMATGYMPYRSQAADYDWTIAPYVLQSTFASLTSVLARRRSTPKDCMDCHVKEAAADPRDTTTSTTS